MTVGDAAQRLRSGEVVAFPTETVYGLGANALDADAVRKVFKLKGRPATSPLIVHVASIEMARQVVAEWPDLAQQLATKWWPGPLTLVLPKLPAIPDVVTAGLPTVGVRMPAHPLALELIRETGLPLAAPSANLFTGLSPTTAEHVRRAFGDRVPVLDGGPCSVGIESTVVAIEDGGVKLLRPGMISLGDLEQVTAGEGSSHPAPGMHARHYSPRARVYLLSASDALPAGNGAWLYYRGPRDGRAVRLPADPDAYAAGLYAALHDLDQEGVDWIAVEIPPETGEWVAVRDRLRRAVG